MDYTKLTVRLTLFVIAMLANVALMAAFTDRPVFLVASPFGTLAGWLIADALTAYRRRKEAANVD